jgi:hypothetical protein
MPVSGSVKMYKLWRFENVWIKWPIRCGVQSEVIPPLQGTLTVFPPLQGEGRVGVG